MTHFASTHFASTHFRPRHFKVISRRKPPAGGTIVKSKKQNYCIIDDCEELVQGQDYLEMCVLAAIDYYYFD